MELYKNGYFVEVIRYELPQIPRRGDMAVKLSRRDFIKAGSAAAAGLAFLKFKGPLGEREAFAQATAGKVEWRPNICTMCPNICGINVAVKEVGSIERAVKIEGNPNHPYNWGKICARGQSGIRRLYNPDRIRTPLIRVEGSKRGEWAFRKATWKEAYEYIGKKMKENNIKPYEVALFSSWLNCVFTPILFEQVILSLVLQIPNVVPQMLHTCMFGHILGIDSVTGNFNAHGELIPDLGNADMILAMRSNVSLSTSIGRTVRLRRSLKNGSKLVIMDPRMSEIGTKATKWLPVKPGTDQAVLLAILREIIIRKTYNEKFLKSYTNAPFLAFKANNTLVLPAMKTDSSGNPCEFYVYDEISQKVVGVPSPAGNNLKSTDGKPIKPSLEVPEGLTWNGKPVKTIFQFLKEKVKPFTPAWASKISGVPEKDIAEVARDFATTESALVHSGWHDARYENSIQTWRTAALIQTLKGKIDTKGGWIFNAEFREEVKKFWDEIKAGKKPMIGPGIQIAVFLHKIYADPKKWVHGHPAVGKVWSDQERKAGRKGVAYVSVGYVGVPEAMEGKLTYKGEPYRIKAVVLSGSNIVRTGFSDETWKKVLSNDGIKLVVAHDILPTDTLLYADVILPDFSYLERGDQILMAEAPDLAFVARYPVKPIVDGKHIEDILVDFASMFGKLDEYLKHVSGMFGWDYKTLKRTVDEARKKGVSVSRLLRDMTINGLAAKLGRSPSSLKKEFREKGVVSLKSQDELIKECGLPYKYPLPTPSGRLEVYSLLFAHFIKFFGYMPNWDPIVEFVPPMWRKGLKPEDEPKKDEFLMAYGKAPTMTHTSTADNDLLMAITRRKGNLHLGVWINEGRAAELGIMNGDEVILENTETGQRTKGKAFLTQLIRPDTIFIPSNFGAESKMLKTAYGKGCALNKIIPFRLDPVAGIPETCQLTVRVRKA